MCHFFLGNTMLGLILGWIYPETKQEGGVRKYAHIRIYRTCLDIYLVEVCVVCDKNQLPFLNENTYGSHVKICGSVIPPPAPFVTSDPEPFFLSDRSPDLCPRLTAEVSASSWCPLLCKFFITFFQVSQIPKSPIGFGYWIWGQKNFRGKKTFLGAKLILHKNIFFETLLESYSSFLWYLNLKLYKNTNWCIHVQYAIVNPSRLSTPVTLM